MHHVHLELLIGLIAAAVFLVTLTQKMRLSATIAYLSLGIFLGPSSFDILGLSHSVDLLAELGIVFLLFTIGLELSLNKLWQMRHQLILIGGGQVLLTLFIPFTVAVTLGMSPVGAFVTSASIALSSTAVVTKYLKEQGELYLPHGQAALAILIFQDIAAIPLLIIIPLLGQQEFVLQQVFIYVVLNLLALPTLIWLGKKGLNSMFRFIASFDSKELFLMTAVLVVLATGLLTQKLGLSMSLGAFISGLILGETQFKHEIEGDILPFRDILLGVFFVSVGLRVDLWSVLDNWHWVAIFTGAIIVFKFALLYTLETLFGKSSKATGFTTSVLLAHGGEFGFALLTLGLVNNLVDEFYAGVIIAGLVASMFVAPILYLLLPIMRQMLSLEGAGASTPEAYTCNESMIGHTVLCGFGRVGQEVAQILLQHKIPYVAIEHDVDIVTKLNTQNMPVIYGDATRPNVLQAARLQHAKTVLLALGANLETKVSLIQYIKSKNPQVRIIMRTSLVDSIPYLIGAGADVVLADTFELSLALSAQLLATYGTPSAVIHQHLNYIRQEHYQDELLEFGQR